MNNKHFQWVLYVIVIVILGTISIQLYWNYKNYQTNKQQLINDVQVSLDNAIETYYANLAEKSTVGFAIEMASKDDIFSSETKFDSLINKLHISGQEFKNLDSISLEVENTNGIKIFKGKKADSLLNTVHNDQNSNKHLSKKNDFRTLNIERLDSASINDIKVLTSKVIISLSQDSLNLASIDTLIKQEILRKNVSISFSLSLKTNKDEPELYNEISDNTSSLSTTSKSTFLPKNSILTIHFTNATKEILKRSLTGILLSTLLVLAVISCLFYLLKIIKHQKQIAEVKNDFISNITHEFKTPIATIGVALESIKDFNVINDKEKTQTYLNMSSNQLSKLNLMVEKLLETATLDSDSLKLIKKEYNITELLKSIIDKHQIQANGKTINFKTLDKEIFAKVDVFHFENAINNIIDNAIKYGGKIISVNLKKQTNQINITISDNGNTLTKSNKDQIFEKFYRIPKGNTHNVKGFGIGLYYAKKIIEKHGGTIRLDLNNKLTTFKISLAN